MVGGGRTREPDHVSDNKAQNRQFRDAARGLTKAQKERLRRVVESDKKRYENYDYHRIKELADEIMRRDNEKLQQQ
jgi:hypothetical protein